MFPSRHRAGTFASFAMHTSFIEEMGGFMNPFDVPGPQFLGLFIAGGFVALLVAVVIKHFAARPGRRPRDEPLQPEQLAYLVGGLEHAIEATVAGLSQRGALVIDDGTLKAVYLEPQLTADGVYRGRTDTELSELESFVLHEVRRGNKTISALVARASSFEHALRDPLLADGLLVADPEMVQRWAMLPPVLWCAVGTTKIMVGLSRHRPVGFLVVLVIALVMWARSVAKAPRRTTRGDAVVDDAKRRYAALEVTAGSAPVQLSARDMSLAYAMFGAAILAPTLAALMPSYQRSLLVGTTSSWISSCGSSCGGGCGGGCGGCGGCS
jgi:uncharacterized protein (TIGR04222 family)